MIGSTRGPRRYSRSVQGEGEAASGCSPSKVDVALYGLYGYDSLDRLTTVNESGTGNWSEAYNYDSFGNRWVTPPGLSLTQETPTSPTWYNTATNQLTGSLAGWGYDGQGNVKNIPGMSRQFTYDAENRLITSIINSSTTTNTYDGDGHRGNDRGNGVSLDGEGSFWHWQNASLKTTRTDRSAWRRCGGAVFSWVGRESNDD
jgi:YD repeat-containing protein